MKKLLYTVAALTGAFLLLKRKPASGVGDVHDVTDEEAIDGWRIYCWVLFSPDLFDQTYEIFMQDRSGHGFPAVRNLKQFLEKNMPYPYNNMAEDSYEVAAYNLVSDYYAILDGRLDREKAFRLAAAELQAARMAYN